MHKIFTRNFLIFTVMLLVGSTALAFGLITGNKDINMATTSVLASYETIKMTETLGAHVENIFYMVDSSAHYQTEQLETLTPYQQNALEHLDKLQSKMPKKGEQYQRLMQIKSTLDKSVSLLNAGKVLNEDELAEITKIRASYNQFYKEFLEAEYTQLDMRLKGLNTRKDHYFTSLLASVIIGTILLFLFNIYLFSAQRKRSATEKILQEMEDRLVLAFEGTDDGIFDWDIRTDKVYYSARFFSMLGYKHKPMHGTLKNFEDLLNPSDKKRVWAYVDLYLSGKIKDYNQEFRLKHANGEWVWINARAKGLFDEEGNCYRMVGAHTDISQSKRTQAILKSQKEAAEKANQAKSEFLAHMSHEIRTPLTAISGIVEILNDKKNQLQEKQRKLIETLRSSTDSLKDLINDILDFSKIESQEIVLDNTSFSLHDLLTDVINMMSVRAKEKGIEFSYDDSETESYQFYGDRLRLRQILVNLITNAIKFTDKGKVTVKASIDTNRKGTETLVVDVKDTGIGIKKEDQSLIFEKFKQADTSVSRRYGGTGLGLPISRNLAQIMGGDIALTWSEAGKGSKFTLRLPIRYEEIMPQSTTDIPKTKENLDKKLKKKAEEGVKILVVEDYEGSLIMLGYIFDDLGMSYDVANTGFEALELWQNTYYDLILMDVQMPEMDGFTATKKIRMIESSNKFTRTPIIGMTAHALVEDWDKCFEVGMDTYLVKPIIEKDLKREILKFLETKKKAA